MMLGKIAVLIVALGIALGLSGLGATLKNWAGSDPVSAITLADVDARKDDGTDAIAADNDDDRGDGDRTRGNDGTGGGNNTGDGDRTRGNDGSRGGNNTGGGGGGASYSGGGGGGGGGSASGGGAT